MNSTEQAKRLIFEAPDTTKRTSLILVGTLLLILINLGLSFKGTGSSWNCELDSANPRQYYICKQLQRSASCRTLTGPLQAEIMINSNNEVKASAYIVCPWENAMSELRICFALGAGLSVFIGLLALMKEDKKLAEFHFNSVIFFSLLLGIAAIFDLLAVSNSKSNNFAMCNLTDDFKLEEGIVGERIECSHGLYELTGWIGWISTAALLTSGYFMREWKNNLSFDGL